MADKIILLGNDDRESFAGLITDLVNEKKLPDDGTWNYVVKMFSLDEQTYLGAYLYYDGPIESHSSGAYPSYRKFILVSADWEQEIILSGIADLWDCIGKTTPIFKHHPFARTEAGFVQRQVSSMNLAHKR